MNAVDTNVLLYVHDHCDRDKQATAAALLDSWTDGVLLWQVACEYIAASRKLAPFGYSHAQTWRDIDDLHRVWTTIPPSWNVLERAASALILPGMWLLVLQIRPRDRRGWASSCRQGQPPTLSIRIPDRRRKRRRKPIGMQSGRSSRAAQSDACRSGAGCLSVTPTVTAHARPWPADSMDWYRWHDRFDRRPG